MMRTAAELDVEFEVVESAAWVLQLNKQHEALTRRQSGLREQVWERLEEAWSRLKERCGEQAHEVLCALSRRFTAILQASSAAEWVHSQVSPALRPHKRLSSGLLQLRTAYLNLHTFSEGKRKGLSPHQLLTGEPVEDWLERLGYEASPQPVRTLKSLGWPRLVDPFTSTWRQDWLSPGAAHTSTPPSHQQHARAASA